MLFLLPRCFNHLLFHFMHLCWKALPLLQRNLELGEACLDPDGPEVAAAMYELALLYSLSDRGRYVLKQHTCKWLRCTKYVDRHFVIFTTQLFCHSTPCTCNSYTHNHRNKRFFICIFKSACSCGCVYKKYMCIYR